MFFWRRIFLWNKEKYLLQFISSLASSQSTTWLQRDELLMQEPSLHWNSDALHRVTKEVQTHICHVRMSWTSFKQCNFLIETERSHCVPAHSSIRMPYPYTHSLCTYCCRAARLSGLHSRLCRRTRNCAWCSVRWGSVCNPSYSRD